MAPKLIPFQSKGAKKTKLLGKTDGEIIDHGVIDSLDYEVYKRGANSDTPILVLHIIQKASGKKKELRFKKDADVFKSELEAINFDDMSNGDRHEIKGSGDNDNLIVKKMDGEFTFELKKRGLDIIDKVKHIIEKNTQKAKAV